MKIVRCYHCNHEWATKQDNPKTCPKCKTTFWNTPYKRKRGRKKLPMTPERIEQRRKWVREAQRRFRERRAVKHETVKEAG